MSQATTDIRQFSVRTRHADRHHARIVAQASFEAAAVAYLEDFHAPATDGHEISVIVRELDTGHEHCFRVDLDSGETAACG